MRQGAKDARRQANKWIFPHRQILFILLVSYFNGVCSTFYLGKIFIRFLSIIFNIYSSLAPQRFCITVTHSGGMVLPSRCLHALQPGAISPKPLCLAVVMRMRKIFLLQNKCRVAKVCNNRYPTVDLATFYCKINAR